jgi:hypothetical protein
MSIHTSTITFNVKELVIAVPLGSPLHRPGLPPDALRDTGEVEYPQYNVSWLQLLTPGIVLIK